MIDRACISLSHTVRIECHNNHNIRTETVTVCQSSFAFMIGSEVTRQCVIVPSAGHHQPSQDHHPGQIYQQQEQHHDQYVAIHELCDNGHQELADLNQNHHNEHDDQQHQQLHLDDGDGWVGCDFGDSDCVAGGECNCCAEMEEDDEEETVVYQDYHSGDLVEEYDEMGETEPNGSSSNIEEYLVVANYGCPQEMLLP